MARMTIIKTIRSQAQTKSMLTKYLPKDAANRANEDASAVQSDANPSQWQSICFACGKVPGSVPDISN